jgi:orotidine-5'-phosphate decarboxylase
MRRATQAKAAQVHGLILSAEEVADMRKLVGPDMLLVTPGIRPANAELGDQKRVMTPARAIQSGADHLVIGRPVTQAVGPAASARAIVAEIESAQK